jgi:hypothetical protein
MSYINVIWYIGLINMNEWMNEWITLCIISHNIIIRDIWIQNFTSLLDSVYVSKLH